MIYRQVSTCYIFKEKEIKAFDEQLYMEGKKKKRNDLINPAWVETDTFRGGELVQMNQEEKKFWDGFVDK